MVTFFLGIVAAVVVYYVVQCVIGFILGGGFHP